VAAEVRERLAVSNQRWHTFLVEGLKPKKLTEAEGKEQYCVEVSSRFIALEDSDTEVDINST
jgi:hypothetical protein